MHPSPAFAVLAESAQASPPQLALVLGSGMTEVASRLRAEVSVLFAEVPGLPATTVVGHAGRLALGEWAGRRILIFSGRLHLYEGHAEELIVRPLQIAHSLGARILFLTNAAGGIHDALQRGSLMAIREHLDWTRPYSWRRSDPPRPIPYSPRLLTLLRQAAAELAIPLHEGIYAQLTGPCYETPAEIRALRTCGADAVGMSTGRDAQAAFDLGMEVAGLSFIANRAAGLSTGPIDHSDVLATSALVSGPLGRLLERFLQLLAE